MINSMHALRKALGRRALRLQQTKPQALKSEGLCHFEDVGQWRVQSAGLACLEIWSRSHSTVPRAASGFADDLASYVHGASTQRLLGDTISRNLAKTVQKFPDKLAVSSMHQKVRLAYKTGPVRPKDVHDQDAVQKRLTYMDFDQAVEQISRGLLGIGVKPGESVRYCNEGSHEAIIILTYVLKPSLVLAAVISLTNLTAKSTDLLHQWLLCEKAW